jgi:hypothetical protein
MQLRACIAQKQAADTALALVQTALATIDSGSHLTLEELCNLTRSMEMGNQHAIARELINEQITPDEERAYMTWVAARPADEVKAMQEYGAAVRVLFRSLQDLRERKADPASSAVQALIVQWNQLAVRHELRKFMTTLLEWNPTVAQKWMQVGEIAMSRSMAPQQTTADEGLWDYFGKAQEASSWHQSLRHVVEDATKLVESRVEASSPPAIALSGRLTQICADHSLGSPLIYARWAGAMQYRRSTDENTRSKGAWMFLVDALQANAFTA